MITLLKDCFDFSSWNSRVTNVIAFIVTMLLLAGSGHVIYGIVHVTGEFNDMQHITNAMYALQSLQVPLQKAEHAAFYLSLATNVANATTRIPQLQAQINKIYIATNQLNSVDVVMGMYVLDTLRFPLEIWSQMITMASVNASASVPYLKTMLGLYAAQLPYSETIISMADSTCNTADQATADNTKDLINLSEFIIIYMGFAMFANLLLASLRMSYYRDMASDALAIKDRFLVLISHEMRTPMNGVLGSLQLLYDSLIGSVHQPLVRAAMSSAEALLSMVNNLLDYRILNEDVSVSKTSHNVVSVNFYSLFLEIEAMIRPAMQSKGLNYCQLYYSEVVGHVQGDTNVPSWPSRVKVDRVALVQVTMNLLSNAHKFTPSNGSVTVVITLLAIHPSSKVGSSRSMLSPSSSSSVTSEHESIAIEMEAVRVVTTDFAVEMARFRIEIIDTGVGISPTQLKNVFEVFSGDSDITTRAFDGLGLGLAISSKLATRKLGTHITATSVLSQGSTFSFELDLSIDTEACSGLEQPMSAMQSMTPSSGVQSSPSIVPCPEFSQQSAGVSIFSLAGINDGVMFAASSRPLIHTMASISEYSAEAASVGPESDEVTVKVVHATVVAAEDSANIVTSSFISAVHEADHSHQPLTTVNVNAALSTNISIARYLSPPFNVVTTRPMSLTSPENTHGQPVHAPINYNTSAITIKPIRAYSMHPLASMSSSLVHGAETYSADDVLLKCDPDSDPEDQTKSPVDVDLPKIDALALGHHITTQTPNNLADSAVTLTRSDRVGSMPISQLTNLDSMATGVRLSKSDLKNELGSAILSSTQRPSTQSDKSLHVSSSLSALPSAINIGTPAVLSTAVPLPRPASMPSVGRFLALPRPRTINVLPLASGVVPGLPLASGIVPVLPLNSSRSVLPSPMASASLGLTSSLKGHRGASALASAIGVHQTSAPVHFSLDCKSAADGLNQKVAISMLEKMGHSVVLAENGQEAVDKWKATSQSLSPINFQRSAKVDVPEYDWKESVSPIVLVPKAMPFDICLMDLSMPVLDGYDATTKIRALEKSIKDSGHEVIPLPIVAVSANSIDAKPRCLSVGMQGFLSKPIRKSELVEFLFAFGCGRHPMHSTPRTSITPGQGLRPAATRIESGVGGNNVKSQTNIHVDRISSIKSNKTLRLAISTAAQHSPLLHPSDSNMVITPINRRTAVSAVGYSVPTLLFSKNTALESTSMPPLRILLAEDNQANQRFALALLYKMGHTVVLAENGQHAVDKWHATQSNLSRVKCGDVLSANVPQPPFDICLMALSMPVIDGYDATTLIRDLEKSMMEAGHQVMPLPIVAVSANSIAANPRCLAVGMQACLTKPVRKSELIEVLLTFACGRPFLPVPAVQLAGSLNLPIELTMVTTVSSLRILLVENSLPKNRVHVNLLESLGHSVVIADNGLEAVDKLRAAMLFITSGNDTGLDQSPDSLQTRITGSTAPKYNSNVSSTVTSPELLTGSVCGPFDLCLMDLTLPFMDGYMTTTMIRAVEKVRGAKLGKQVSPMSIVALSVSPIEDKPRCVAAGMQGCITKPFLREELVHQLSCIPSVPRQSILIAPRQLISPGLDSSILGIRMLPMHILVVEDNRSNQRHLVSMLEKMGHSVVLAENGQEAVNKWRITMPAIISAAATSSASMSQSWCSVSLKALVPSQAGTSAVTGSPPNIDGLTRPFDICLMNLSMPVMDGFVATNIIRAIEQSLCQAGEHIIPLVIVAVTGKSIESKTQCLASGMQGFLSSPVIQEELVFQLQVFGSQRHQQQRLLTPSSRPVMAPLVSSIPNMSGIVSPFTDPTVQFPLTSRQSLAIQHQRMHTPTAKRHSVHSFDRADLNKMTALPE